MDKIKNFILDTLFPISCVSCGSDNAWLCEECFAKINFVSFHVCPKCEQIITENGRLCASCRGVCDLDALVTASKYRENDISKLVHLYKYRFVSDLSIPLGKILVECLLKSHLPMPDIIIAVPLHKRRLRWRGFNQSQLLADYISQNLTPGFTIPTGKNILQRKRHTPPQMKVKKYSDRKNNLQNAFSINGAENIKNKTVLLVDDISTTGATLFECAKILKQNGAKKVFGVVISRQELS